MTCITRFNMRKVMANVSVKWKGKSFSIFRVNFQEKGFLAQRAFPVKTVRFSQVPQGLHDCPLGSWLCRKLFDHPFEFPNVHCDQQCCVVLVVCTDLRNTLRVRLRC